MIFSITVETQECVKTGIYIYFSISLSMVQTNTNDIDDRRLRHWLNELNNTVYGN